MKRIESRSHGEYARSVIDAPPEAHTGNFLSAAFSPDINGSEARSKLREIGKAAALEFRMSDELFDDESADGAMRLRIGGPPFADDEGVVRVLPLGDKVVEAQPVELALKVVSESVLLPRVKGWYARMIRGQPHATRRAYLYDEAVFSDHSTGRPVERTLVCIACDVMFDPYARGFWEAMTSTRTNVRIDLRSAMNLIWTWGTSDHRALAYALAAARHHPNGSWTPFEPFTKLYRRVLQLHWADDERCEGVAEFLSTFTVERLQFVRPGRSALRHLYGPALAALREHDDPALHVDLTDTRPDPIAALLVRHLVTLHRKPVAGSVRRNSACRARFAASGTAEFPVKGLEMPH